ncbi:MGMT family protein [Streptomyces sp. BI20]|uniref:MGMT family protein n=1 Tax=Streptomyces sp. BI20 TaxID=3403460 RepID=UPI003C737D63
MGTVTDHDPADPTAHDPADPPPGPGELPDYAERVLSTTELIPPGRVMTYGDVAEWLGTGGPRQVGAVMARWGGAVPWWRVVRSDGRPLPGHEHRALPEYRAEGTPLRDSATGPRVDMRRARWNGRPDHPTTPTDHTQADPHH